MQHRPYAAVTIAEIGGHDDPKRPVTINRNDRSRSPKYALGLDPLSGALFVFINRRGSQVKVLYWDRSGFCIWGKRLERGRFVSDWSQMKSSEIDWTQFKLLLEGFVVTRQRLRYSVARITREAA